MIGGTAATTSASCWRDSGVANSATIAELTAISTRPSPMPTAIVARRESRTVLPKTLP